MEGGVFASVKYNGECKVIEVNHNSSFIEIKAIIIDTWVDLKSENIKCMYSVGNLHNCVLGCDSDLQNMLLVCQHVAEMFVAVDISNNASPIHHTTESIENGHTSNMGGKKNAMNRCDRYVEESNTSSFSETEFMGKGKLPNYDVCPILKKKPLLSDDWVSIMSGGVGLVFQGGAVEFRTELIKYTTRLGYKFKYYRNDPRYIHATCYNHDCGWFIKAKLQKVTKYFVVSKVNLTHKCVGKVVTGKGNRLAPKIIGKMVLQDVKSNPALGGKGIMPLMKDSYGMNIPYWKAHRTAENAKAQIYGGYNDSYNQLRWYCEAISRTNPGSVVELKANNETNCFERVFIAFKGSIDGFKSCRPMLFIDGTFMKGRAKGTLLSATAKDGDNGLFPVALAIVSAENVDNWAWFLAKLRDNLKHKKQVFYISDRNTGLMSAFPKVFEEPVHFFCLFHLLTNLKGRFSKGWSNTQRESLGEHFRDCAYAPNTRIFEDKVKIFKEVGGTIAEKWLEDLPLENWAVAHSTHMRRYGEMTSNAAESFNSWINEDRCLPITHMIESIRARICGWFVQRREKSKKWTGFLCQSKEVLWNYLTDIGLSWNVVECPNGDFQVLSKPSVIVSVSLRICTCYQWQITGFPCSHAVAVIRLISPSAHRYIDECFFATSYRQSYMSDINPIPDTERFECQDTTDQPKILPPILGPKPGRPKRKREPSYGEYRKKKRGKLSKYCKWCCTITTHDRCTCPLVCDAQSLASD